MRTLDPIGIEVVAKLLGVCRRTAERWVKAGRLPAPLSAYRPLVRWASGEIVSWHGYRPGGQLVDRAEWERVRDAVMAGKLADKDADYLVEGPADPANETRIGFAD